MTNSPIPTKTSPYKPLPVAPEDRKLSAQQRRVVEHIIETGATNTETAKALNLHRQTVQRILHLPQVEKELQRLVAKRLKQSAALGASTMIKLARGAKSEYVQMEAAKDLLDRTGYKPPDRQQVELAGDFTFTIDLG